MLGSPAPTAGAVFLRGARHYVWDIKVNKEFSVSALESSESSEIDGHVNLGPWQ